MEKQKTAGWLRKTYIEFMVLKGHIQIPSSPLIPENNPSLLFVNSGMFPLIPYLLGEKHPMGRRLCNVQKCVRTEDISSVGNTFYHTFFEMLGHWSLGDYFKKEAIEITFEFLTTKLNIKKEKLFISYFSGDDTCPKDTESYKFWKDLGIPEDHLFALPKSENWWIAGEKGPCGPDTEVFVDTGKNFCCPNCKPSCKCGKFLEIWNNVFIEYNKKEDGTLEPLKQKNVDVGIGIDRTVSILEETTDNYLCSHWKPLLETISKETGLKYEDNKKEFRILADHSRAIAFLLSENIKPTNTEQGYVVRRIIRKAMQVQKKINAKENLISKLIENVIDIYQPTYPQLSNKELIFSLLGSEQEKFGKALQKGLKLFGKKKEVFKKAGLISAKEAFDFYQSYGFPIELTKELALEDGLPVDENGYIELLEKHKESSRSATKGFFKGGLSGNSEMETKYHTATHLLHGTLRKILGTGVSQKGSNITSERLRFDFSYERKLTDLEIEQVEREVNKIIELNIPVTLKVISLLEAKKEGALAFFAEKYGDVVKVYSVGDFSHEVCGGPHVKETGGLGRFKIIKEEAVSQGVRRIKAILE